MSRRRSRRQRGCPRTGKTRFRDEADARAALHRTRKRVSSPVYSDPAPAAERVYACAFCGGWHLTSRPT